MFKGGNQTKPCGKNVGRLIESIFSEERGDEPTNPPVGSMHNSPRKRWAGIALFPMWTGKEKSTSKKIDDEPGILKKAIL